MKVKDLLCRYIKGAYVEYVYIIELFILKCFDFSKIGRNFMDTPYKKQDTSRTREEERKFD
jgi:hypothetical protein